jgi:hypothetical protein
MLILFTINLVKLSWINWHGYHNCILLWTKKVQSLDLIEHCNFDKDMSSSKVIWKSWKITIQNLRTAGLDDPWEPWVFIDSSTPCLLLGEACGHQLNIHHCVLLHACMHAPCQIISNYSSSLVVWLVYARTYRVAVYVYISWIIDADYAW